VPLQGSALVFTEVGVWGPAGLGLVKGADGGLVWKGRTPYRLGRMKAHRRWLQKEPVASQSWGSYIFSSFTCHHQLDGLAYPHIHTLQWSHMTVFCSCVYGLLHSTIVRMFERGIWCLAGLAVVEHQLRKPAPHVVECRHRDIEGVWQTDRAKGNRSHVFLS